MRNASDAYEPLAVTMPAEFPPSTRLFTEADIRATVMAIFAATFPSLSAPRLETDADVQGYLDGWLCEPFKRDPNDGDPPTEAIERAARALAGEFSSILRAGIRWDERDAEDRRCWIRMASVALQAALDGGAAHDALARLELEEADRG